MSGITPILDTLLHQVLGRRVDTPVTKDQPAPVSPSASSDAIQPARSDSRLHQQSQGRLGETSSEPLRANARPVVTTASVQVGQPSTQTHLSRAATEIAEVLSKFPPQTESTIKPSAPLLRATPASAESVANALSRSIAESGAFYESHLMRWVAGSYPRAALWREPQAWLALSFQPLAPTVSSLSPSLHAWSPFLRSGDRVAKGDADGQQPGTAPRIVEPLTPSALQGQAPPTTLRPSSPWLTERIDSSLPSESAMDDGGEAAPAGTRTHQLSQHAPESLQALVRQQLELIVSPSVRWEGQLWPGVTLTLVLTESTDERVDEETARRERGVPIPHGRWRAELHMTLPRLGEITMTLETAGGEAWRIAIEPHREASRDPVAAGLASLQERFKQGGVAVDVSLGERGGSHG